MGSTDEVVKSLLSAPGFATLTLTPRSPARLYLSQMLGDKRRPSATVPSTQPPPSLVQLLGHRQSLTPELLHGSLSVFPPCSAYCPPHAPLKGRSPRVCVAWQYARSCPFFPPHPSLRFLLPRSLCPPLFSAPASNGSTLCLHSCPPPPTPTSLLRLGSGAANRCCLLLIWVRSD